jgi:hypothetical protein
MSPRVLRPLLPLFMVPLLGSSSIAQVAPQGPSIQSPQITLPKITLPVPRVAAVTASPAYPFVQQQLHVVIRDFPAPFLDVQQTVVSGSPRFVRRSNLILIRKAARADDNSMSFDLTGWFESAGAGQIIMTLVPLNATGKPMTAIKDTATFTVSAPTQYAFTETGTLTKHFGPTMSQFGIGSVCQCDGNALCGGKVIGVTTVGSDMEILIRGGAIDQLCEFKTQPWILPEGVRLKEIRWKSVTAGDRCGPESVIGPGAPNPVFHPLTKGTVVIDPDANAPVESFIAFSDTALVYDGVSYAANLTRPTTMLLPIAFESSCLSSLFTGMRNGVLTGPTTDPQAYGIVLDKVVFEGPPGLDDQFK